MNGLIEWAQQEAGPLVDRLAALVVASGIRGDLALGLGLAGCLVVALLVRSRDRASPSADGAAEAPEAQTDAQEPTPDTGAQERGERVAAVVAAAMTSFRALVLGEGGPLRAIRLEEDGRHLSWAVSVLAGLAHDRAGEVRTIGPALEALEGGDTGPAHRVLGALGAADPAGEVALARAQAAMTFVHHPEAALEPARRAARLAPDKPEVWSLLSIVADRSGDTDTARAACEKVVALAVGSADRDMLAAALGTLGEIHRRGGVLERAEAYFRIALTYQVGLARPEGMVRHYRSLSQVYQALGDWSQAGEVVAKALALEAECGHSAGMADLEVQAGLIAERRGNLSDACGHWTRARRLFVELGRSDKVEALDTLTATSSRPEAPPSAPSPELPQ